MKHSVDTTRFLFLFFVKLMKFKCKINGNRNKKKGMCAKILLTDNSESFIIRFRIWRKWIGLSIVSVH